MWHLKHGVEELRLEIHVQRQQQWLPVLLLVDEQLTTFLLHTCCRHFLYVRPDVVGVLWIAHACHHIGSTVGGRDKGM